MPQPAYTPEIQVRKVKMLRKGCLFWGLTKSASPHYSQVFLVAMGNKGKQPLERERKPPLETQRHPQNREASQGQVRGLLYCTGVGSKWAVCGGTTLN